MTAVESDIESGDEGYYDELTPENNTNVEDFVEEEVLSLLS